MTDTEVKLLNNIESNNNTESISRTNVNRHNNDTRILEFMQDLKEAIQNGEFQQCEQTRNAANKQTESSTESNEINDGNLINVNNLSNQTFNYIINWLKQQQIQNTDEKDQSNKTETDLAEQEVTLLANTETQMLRTQMRLVENEKDKLFGKFKELQEENTDLRNKLLNLKKNCLSSDEQTNNSVDKSHGMMLLQKSTAQLLNEKDIEIQRLQQIIEELIKSNEEKEKRCEDLSKQVSRFKRIQEIVISAQTATGFKNKIDLDFDTNSDSNSLPSINGDDLSIQILSNKMKTSKSPAPAPPVNHSASPKQLQTLTSNLNQACSMISSCSLSSSLSSSSTSSNTSTSSSSTQQQQQPQNNVNHLMAPLATISELNTSTDPKRKSIGVDQQFSTLPSAGINSCNDPKRFLSDMNAENLEPNNIKYKSLNKLNNSSSNNSSNTMVNESCTDEGLSEIQHILMANSNFRDSSSSKNAATFSQNLEIFKMTKKSTKQKQSNTGSMASLNNDIIKKASQQAEKNDKYLNGFNSRSKKQNSVPPQSNKTASPSHTNTNSIKNFFGKLIRTSLVNINESGFSATLDKKKSVNKQQSVDTDSLINRSMTSFKRGGVRATANARLQHNTYSLSNSCISQFEDHRKNSYLGKDLDTLSFAKLNNVEVYDWLNKNGFENYFPYNSDGYVTHKWLKNGLHLLQATPADYEKELGIKNPLHRKRLGLLLQAMYNVGNFTQLEINYTNSIDQMWVTKWLDDIGLPQYKDVFNEGKIDGLMLNNLTNEDMHLMNIQSELHYLSIKRAIHVLRLKEFNPQCLRRRPSGDEFVDKSEVILWTNHRVMEWLRSIDLSEYAPNLRGSGVHGALMVFEGRFNATTLADILAIPASKTLLRRHLTTLFIDLIGPQMHQLKRDTESQPNYQPLSAASKLKLNKRSIGSGLFSHKRTKSQERDFLTSPVLRYGEEYRPFDDIVHGSSLSGPVNAMIASFREETASFDNEISISRMTKGLSKERTFN